MEEMKKEDWKRTKIIKICLTLVRMTLLALLCRMANTFECPCSASPPADPKLVSEDTNKMSSVNSLLALHKLHTQVNILGFTFLDLLIKMMEMRLLYILYCPPPPTCDCKDLLILGHTITSPPSPPPPSHIEWVLKSARDAAITSHFRPEILI